MRRPVLYIERILKWADAHRRRTGNWPRGDSGRVRDVIDEKWVNIDQALRVGLRGLPGRSSLAQLLAERRGRRNRKRLPKYTIRQILTWTDLHHSRTGRWPVAASGPIAYAPGETWLAVDIALRHGRRGLPGGTSLPRLLEVRRRVRNRLRIPRLSEAAILRWADAHYRRTGNWPIAESGTIVRSGGETWAAIDHALKKGARGLRAGSSLFRVLSQRRGMRRHVRKPPLSVDDILAWADAYHRRNRRWPTEKSGAIPEAPGETWGSVQAALRKGTRNLPGGWALAILLAKHRGVRNVHGLPRLSERQIIRWVNEYVQRHGRRPTRDSGPIPKSDGETWNGVNVALQAGHRGLPGGSSLAKLVTRCFSPHRTKARDRG